MRDFSQYIVYVDESGHASPDPDPNYPCFVLALCLFEKSYYCKQLAPRLQELKFRFFGHDMAIMHEREIRKSLGPFSILKDKETRTAFFESLSHLVEQAKFTVISKTILKEGKHLPEDNLYHIAVQHCLEDLYAMLKKIKEHEKVTHVVFEKRGNLEDSQLELEFRRICSGDNRHQSSYPFIPVFASKKANSSGLQFADLVARPIGLAKLKPKQENRAYDILKKKVFSLPIEQVEFKLD
ncbi:DUF3800 domain-containing protein [Rubritalea tangerina]|uniref:DUF3800 domain-containing protein n=1 Tax=Rubritalea tangerina TaxID=430798 RepID=A0ABW4ZF55_9BACT